MGTSSSYPGPIGRNALLPPWADPPTVLAAPDADGVEPDAAPATPSAAADGGQSDDGKAAGEPLADITPDAQPPAGAAPLLAPMPWRGAKVAMGRVARSGARDDGRIRVLGRRFVGSLGGSRRAAASSPAGRATARRLGAFLAGVARDGVARTFERLGLTQYVGQPVPALLAALGRVLAPPGETTDDAIAATALHETMAELAEDLGLAENGIDALSRMDEVLVHNTMERFVANIVVARLLHVLSAQLEGGAVTADRAVAVEFEIRDFVESAVALKVGQERLTDLDWDSPRAKAVADDLVRQGYEIFGGGP